MPMNIPPGLLRLLMGTLGPQAPPYLPPGTENMLLNPPMQGAPLLPPEDNTIGFGPDYSSPLAQRGMQNPNYGRPTPALLQGQTTPGFAYTPQNSPGMSPEQRLEASPGLGSYKFAMNPELIEDNQIINQLVGGGIPEEQATLFGTKAATENRRQRTELGSIEKRQQEEIKARERAGKEEREFRLGGEKTKIAEEAKALRQDLLKVGVSADAIPEFEKYIQTGEWSPEGRQRYEDFRREQTVGQIGRGLGEMMERVLTSGALKDPITGGFVADAPAQLEALMPIFEKQLRKLYGLDPADIPESPEDKEIFQEADPLRVGVTKPTTQQDILKEEATGAANKAIADAGQILTGLKRQYPDPKQYVQKTYEQIKRSGAWKTLPEASRKQIVDWLNRTLDRDLYYIALAKGGPVGAQKEYPGYSDIVKKK